MHISSEILNVSLIRYCTIAEKAPQSRKKNNFPCSNWDEILHDGIILHLEAIGCKKKKHIPTANFLGVSRTRQCTLVDCSYKVSVTVALRTPLRLRRQLGSLFATIICRASLQLFVYPLTSRRLNGEIFVVGWHFS